MIKWVVSVIEKYKKSLLLIYFYIFVAQIIFLVEPYVLGKSIDGLLKKEYHWIGIFLFIKEWFLIPKFIHQYTMILFLTI